MPPVLVVMFWCWFAVSLAILLRRGARRATGHSKKVDNRPPIVWPPIDQVDPVRADTEADADVDTVAADVVATDDAAEAEPVTDAPKRAVFTRQPRVNRATNIASALDGIRLPCDLAPLTSGIDDFERRAAFFTVGYPAEAVAPEIADELERIGMEFSAISETTALARRDDLEVRVAVHSVGPAINGVADLTFPTAPANSVVVEFELT